MTITDVNEATPDYGAAVAVDVAENTQTVGTYTATDADGDADLSYTISGEMTLHCSQLVHPTVC